jgi:hypothetical protein
VLTRILGGLHDEDGHITLPGFYDGVKDLPPDILTQWKKLNLTPDSFLKPIGLSLPAGEKDRLLIEQVSSRPTCDINGIIGGYTGEEDGDPGGSVGEGVIPPGGGQNPTRSARRFATTSHRGCPAIARPSSPIIPTRRRLRSTGT